MHKIIFSLENLKKILGFISKFRLGRVTLNTGFFLFGLAAAKWSYHMHFKQHILQTYRLILQSIDFFIWLNLPDSVHSLISIEQSVPFQPGGQVQIAPPLNGDVSHIAPYLQGVLVHASSR